MVIENGYDEAAFSGATPNRHGAPMEKLLLLHSGIIYPGDRDPRAFFQAISNLLETGLLHRDRLLVRFRASSHDEEVRTIAMQCGVADVVEIAPAIAYRDAIAEILAADILLVFQGSSFNAQIPAKIYEYLRAGRPILGVLDLAGDTANRLREFSATSVADINDPEMISSELVEMLRAIKSGEMQASLESNRALVHSLSRESQAKTLARIFTGILCKTL